MEVRLNNTRVIKQQLIKAKVGAKPKTERGHMYAGLL